eukprot:TRINITY_DN36088_c0_g4_i1.p1 TRINITY_DN36088_c0_g4~~TRINITY_DN36088_c0_g4_i1.p1  ORF type:complete len:1004 (+),score=298.91 TRINITY_DN36088_c0_g4_i1:138-3149(+)
MFIAKYLDQKQGEARVVDQREVLRTKLDSWLKTRPALEDVVERGILGRGPRFAAAAGVLDGFLRQKLQAQEEERMRIPPGSAGFSERACQLLSGFDASDDSSLEAQIEALGRQQSGLQAQLAEVETEWAGAAQRCQSAICTEAMPSLSDRGEEAVTRLAQLHEYTGSALAGVFEELASYRRLVARRHCLQDIISMMEKTDEIREIVFAFGSADTMPIAALEELPALCDRLPKHSQAIGIQRLLFLLGPIKQSLSQELERVLAATGQWPLDASKGSAASAAAAAAPQILGLSANLLRAQRTDKLLRAQKQQAAEEAALLNCNGFPAAVSSRALVQRDDAAEAGASWAGDALASPLLARFRYHFCRAESDLCRMDKPDWAFRFLGDLISDHGEVVEKWLAASTAALQPVQAEALKASGLPTALVVAIAVEARLYIRDRVPLLADASSRELLLSLLQHMVRFHAIVAEAAGDKAAAVVVSDFDTNRALPSVDAAVDAGRAEEEQAADNAGGRSFGGVMAGLSRLRKGGAGGTTGEASAAVGKVFAGFEQGLEQFADSVVQETETKVLRGAASQGADGADRIDGFLDLWAAADAQFACQKLLGATSSDAAPGWKARRVKGLPSSELAVNEDVGPEAAEIATLLADLFLKAVERVEVLATKKAQKKYCGRVFDASLRQVVAAVRRRWNALGDVLKDDSREAARLVETLDEICRFVDGFKYAEHFVAAVDDANELRIGTLEKLADLLLEIIHEVVGLLYSDSCVFSYVVLEPLLSLRSRLRPTNFQSLTQRALVKIGQMLAGQLLRGAAFGTEAQLEIFLANCRDDLKAVLGQAALLGTESAANLQPLWDGCALLSMPAEEAASAFSALRQIKKCAPSGFLQQRPWRAAAAAAAEAADPLAMGGEVLRRKLAEVLEGAGVEDLSAAEALVVLGKRPELASQAAADPQELLSAGAEALQGVLGSSAQEALQLGSKLGAHSLKLGSKLSSATTGLSELRRSVLPGRLARRS